jgi:hypothetical protein
MVGYTTNAHLLCPFTDWFNPLHEPRRLQRATQAAKNIAIADYGVVLAGVVYAELCAAKFCACVAVRMPVVV